LAKQETYDEGYENGREDEKELLAKVPEAASEPKESPENIASAWALRWIVSKAFKILETVDDAELLS